MRPRLPIRVSLVTGLPPEGTADLIRARAASLAVVAQPGDFSIRAITMAPSTSSDELFGEVGRSADTRLLGDPLEFLADQPLMTGGKVADPGSSPQYSEAALRNRQPRNSS